MNKNRIAAVTGMTGVGKDFLVHRANREFQIPVLNLGTLVGESLKMDRDVMMSSVAPEEIRRAQFAAYHQAIDQQPAIVTCHAIRPHEEKGYAYDPEMEQLFNPETYVFIHADPAVIHDRIRKRNDSGERKSELLPVQEIDHVQKLKIEAMHDLTAKIGCELLLLNNSEELTAHNINLLSGRIEKLIA